MTINEARQRLTRATGTSVAIPANHVAPEWFVKALRASAREQQGLIDGDAFDLAMRRQRRGIAARLRRMGQHDLAAGFQSDTVPVRVLNRQILAWRAETPDALSGYYARRTVALAGKLGIHIQWAPTIHAGSAWSRFGAVEIPRPLTEELFAVCLHELGHVVTRDEAAKYRAVQDGYRPSVTICPLGEVAAWRAGKALAGPYDWTPRMQAKLRDALATYLPHAIDDEARVMRAFMADESR